MAIILASASPARQAILKNAGLTVRSQPAGIDERAAEAPLIKSGAGADDLAQALAMIKARHVSEQHPADLVIGADQVLEIEGERLSKPADMTAARRQLLKLAGKAHHLHSAVACCRDGAVIWQHMETVRLTMRPLTPAEIGRYLAKVGASALTSVGAYQIEGPGIQLFERIEGDYFAILGLPLLPLLTFLRARGEIE
ncbi:MAG: septum formation inhibitor Maf [Alphaproteobacteria bacterium]|nr:MAG: septum formation inhibitor Maf [Alphaproteobacteria bacterium]